MRVTLLLFLLVLSRYSFAHSVEWITLDFPPYYIVDDKREGLGRDEAVIQLLNQALKEYTVSSIMMPASRAIYALRDTDKLRCLISLYKTNDRAQYLHFSSEYSTIGLPITVALKRATLNKLKLKENSAISLKMLLKDDALHLGFTENRAFGLEIDNVLKSAEQSQLEARPGGDALRSLTMMLLKDRVDLVLGYASEHFYAKQLQDPDDELTQLSLTETPELSFGYVGCSRHEDSVDYLNRVDEVLRKLHVDNRFHEIMLRWLPEGLKSNLNYHLEK
ncbi:TIGR02285 family protein [Pseudoalteromonas xiamenensis]|uniref:TIGR02285 family protein n=1 Tax=Pseudoalteromonas xiamenensis TaxID=882626 RepID=UPI0027E43900|nr:TIGR02285 family protein [Pseudoalteromonas xiamenensis]WMN60201.1 TIGR02285 family protein [Pseudoalteromonas xiamenensis]